MPDLTLLYYTDNTLYETARSRIAAHLCRVLGGRYPIISVSQKPIDLGRNLCIGAIGKSKYNMYVQVLAGAREVDTEWVACVDDDTLYTPGHFDYRPRKDVFSYETNYWLALPGWDYYWRVHDRDKRGGMWGCICRTQLLVDNLSRRFQLYPTEEKMSAAKMLSWGEPGVNDHPYGLDNKLERRYSDKPCLIFIHDKSMGYTQFRRFHRRYGYPLMEDRAESVEPFGKIGDVFKTYFGDDDGTSDDEI